MDDVLFVADGYTRDGYIGRVENMHAALRFRFRPALVRENSAIQQERANADTFDEKVADFLATKIVSWEAGGLKPSAANILKLHPELFLKLFAIVMGWRASQVDPQWSKEQRAKAEAEAESDEPLVETEAKN